MSTTNTETELTVYARIDDPQSLNEADAIEDHIQLESTLTTGGRMRVRKITSVKGGPEATGDRFEITIKEKLPKDAGVGSSLETTQDSDRNFYEAFSQIASRGIVKRRYTFLGRAPKVSGLDQQIVLPAVKFEIDQFVIPTDKPEEKQYSQWVKIDIEIDDILKVLKEQGIDTAQVKQKFSLAAMPFTAEDMFSPESMNEEQKAQLDKLWETEFAMKIKPEIFIKEDSDQPKATGGITSAAQIPDIPEESEEVDPTTDPAQSQSPEGLDNPTDDTTGERTTEEE